MKTLSQITHDYPFSRITLERRMKKIPDFRMRYCTRGKYNRLLINDKGIKLITHEKHNSTSGSFHTRSGKGNQLTKGDLIKTIHQLLDLNSNLKDENKRLKDKRVVSGIKESQKALPNKDLLNQVEANKNTIDTLKLQLDSYKHMSFMDKLRLLFK